MSLPTASKPHRESWLVLALILLVVGGASEGLSRWQQQRTASTIKQLAAPGSITLYTSSTCAYCAEAEDWLNDHDIPWQACSIETDQACLDTFNAAGAPGTPLVRVKDHWHLGFDQNWLAEALKASSQGLQDKPSTDKSPRP
jgi:glutaredoxin